MSLLIVGSIALDTIETPFGKVKETLGGSAVYSSIAASYFIKPCIVAVVGEDFPKSYLSLLKRHNIDITGVEVANGKTFRWSGHYLYDLNSAQTIETQLNVFKSFNPKIPQQYKNIKNIFLANIDPELQYHVYKQMLQPEIVACDTMNYWIENKKTQLKRTLKIVDILLINETEARQLAEESNIIKAAKCIHKMGPKTIVIKRGEYGAICSYKDNIFIVPSYPVENVFDPTGAGDSFAGGFMGYVTKVGKFNNKILRKAIILGTVMGSFCVEKFGVKKISSITYEDILQRYKEIKKITHFENL